MHLFSLNACFVHYIFFKGSYLLYFYNFQQQGYCQLCSSLGGFPIETKPKSNGHFFYKRSLVTKDSSSSIIGTNPAMIGQKIPCTYFGSTEDGYLEISLNVTKGGKVANSICNAVASKASIVISLLLLIFVWQLWLNPSSPRSSPLFTPIFNLNQTLLFRFNFCQKVVSIHRFYFVQITLIKFDM